MLPELPTDVPPWAPRSVLLESQGLAVLRAGERYVSLECGPLGGGHGHPDRLHLTLHADGVHWLPDFGTGSYVSRDLFWYRSTLAHNAPRVDGGTRESGDAVCETFDAPGEWAWMRGRYGVVPRARTVLRAARAGAQSPVRGGARGERARGERAGCAGEGRCHRGRNGERRGSPHGVRRGVGDRFRSGARATRRRARSRAAVSAA